MEYSIASISGKDLQITKENDEVVIRFAYDKELEIIQLICRQKTNKQIADELFLSSRTVEGYRQRISEKCDSTTTAGIVIYAIRHGIYKI